MRLEELKKNKSHIFNDQPLHFTRVRYASNVLLSDLDIIRHRDISPMYPGTESNFLVRQFFRGAEVPRLEKELFVATDSENNIVSFLVGTRKPNKSVKLGPIWVDPAIRGKRNVSSIIEFACSNMSAQYYYMTVPQQNTSMRKAARRSNFHLMAQIPNLYRENSMELVFSRGQFEKDDPSDFLIERSLEVVDKIRLQCPYSWQRGFGNISNEFPRCVIKRGGAVNLLSFDFEVDCAGNMEFKIARRTRPYYYAILRLGSEQARNLLPSDWITIPMAENLTIAVRN